MLYFNKMLVKKALLLLSVFFFLAAAAYAEPVPGRLIVKFKPGVIKIPKGLKSAAFKSATVTAASVQGLAKKYGVTELEQVYKEALEVRPDWTYLADEYRVKFPKEKDLKLAKDDFKKDPNVIDVSTEQTVKAYAITPNDTYYAQQWGLTKIKADQGWAKTTGSTESIIAVLDTGINYNHEDFAGKVDLTDAKNFVSGGTNVMDDYGHGTAVSGVIGAVTDNSKGVAGVDWQAKILPIKVLNSHGSGFISDVSAALAYLTAKKTVGINIVAANMSLGQNNEGANKYAEEDPSSLKERCAEAYNNGIVLVAAAGNDGRDWNSYPAYYSTVIAVAATNQSDVRSVWNATQSSNYGTWIDVSAPGSSIYSTGLPEQDNYGKNTDYYANWGGTSLASPYVAGLAGLVKAANPTMTAQQIITQITTGVDNIDTLNPSYAGKLGSGRINVYKVLGGLLTDITSPATGEYVGGSVPVVGTAAGWNFQNYRLEASKTGTLITFEASSTAVSAGTLGAWNTAGLNGAYTIKLTAFGGNATTYETSVAVTVDNTAPVVAIGYPQNNSAVKGQITISGTAEDLNFDHYKMEYGSGASPLAYYSIGNYYSQRTNSALATWETAGLSGIYSLKMTAYDLAGNSTATSVTFTISSEAPTKEVRPINATAATFVLPNPFDRATTTEAGFIYTLTGNFNTTLYLFDLSGNLIWRHNYPAGENGGKSGTNNPPWDGKNLFGEAVANGVYIYQITADNKIIARGKLIVI